MKFKFDYMVFIGFILALIFLHNAIVYGSGLGAAIIGEWMAIIALFALGIWAMIVKSPAPKIEPAHHEAIKHETSSDEKKIEG